MSALSHQPSALGLRVQELAALTLQGGRLEIKIQRKLRSPNEYLGMHWREKSRERKAWQAHIVNALVGSLSYDIARVLVRPEILAGGNGGCQIRRRVEVVRLAPGRRNFIRDDDNLRFAVKPVLDALKHIGLIRDDHRKWIELALPTQELSLDGTFWTGIAIDGPHQETPL
jgi:hypothetical protein